jgi:hypothetical protein
VKERNFVLQPFASEGPRPAVEITGHLARRADVLAISYRLQGRLAEVLLPAPQAAPARRHRLWEGTCFEFFLALQEAPPYWEFNLSPAGDWNVYRFSNYRQGQAAEPAFASLPFGVHRSREALRLTLEVDLTRIVPADRPLEVAIAAVIQAPDGRLTYWALTHPGPQADFHRRDGFLMTV